MTEEAIQGTCEDCGKVYKVPSADRTYRCKACGGTVSVHGEDEDEEDFDDEEFDEDEFDDDEEYDDEEDDDEEDVGERRASDRLRHHHGARDSSKAVWIAMAAVLGLGAVAFFLHAADMAPWSDKGEISLDAVNESFAKDWASGDLGSIGGYYHPNARALFDEKLVKMVDLWGWDGDFPAITETTTKITKGTPDDPKTGESCLKFGEGKELTALWQYENSRNKWYMYNFETSSPPIDKRVEELKTLWAKSNPDSLHPLFFNESAVRMITRVRERSAKEGWGGSFPALGDYTSSVDAEGRTRVTFKIPAGDLTAKFGFSQEDYTWYISGFVWP